MHVNEHDGAHGSICILKGKRGRNMPDRENKAKESNVSVGRKRESITKSKELERAINRLIELI